MVTQANRFKQLIKGFNEKNELLNELKMNLNTSECS